MSHLFVRVGFLVLSSFFCATGGGRSEEKVTSLSFYMHDVVTARDPTAVPVARASNRSDGFGTVMVIDDLITEGHSSKSKVVGRGQGTYMECSLDGVSFLLTFVAVLETEAFKGTISFHGSDRIAETVRELAVVGGTGDFRFARGYATIQTQAIKGQNAILLFNVTLKF